MPKSHYPFSTHSTCYQAESFLFFLPSFSLPLFSHYQHTPSPFRSLISTFAWLAMLLLSSGFRMDSGANTRHYQHHQQHTATWTAFWADVTTWLSGKQKNSSKCKKRTSTILTETCGGQDGLLLSSLSDFQRTYYSFPEFDDYDSVEGQENWASLDVTPGV